MSEQVEQRLPEDPTAIPGAESDTMPDAAPRSRTRRSNQLSGVQVMFAAIVAIGLILGIQFTSRLAAIQPLEDAYNSVQVEIDQLRRDQQALIGERDFAQSDAFVEQWARGEGKMTRPGEVLVVPMPAGGTPVPPPAAAAPANVNTTPPEADPWTRWWWLFFDSPPPGQP